MFQYFFKDHKQQPLSLNDYIPNPLTSPLVVSRSGLFHLIDISFSVECYVATAYVNCSTSWVNTAGKECSAYFLLPFSPKATVTSCLVNCGKTVLQTRVMSNDSLSDSLIQEQQSYDYTLYHPSRFVLFIPEIPPALPLSITVHFSESLHYHSDRNCYRYYMPLRFPPSIVTVNSKNSGVSTLRRLNKYKANKSAEKLTAIPTTFSLQVLISTNVPCQSCETSFPLKPNNSSREHFWLKLDPSHRWANSMDLEVEYVIGSKEILTTGVVEHESIKDENDPDKRTSFCAILTPPIQKSLGNLTRIPRAMVFLLDRSVSMSGEPFKNAIKALMAGIKSLDSGRDLFGIVAFDTSIDVFREKLVPATYDNIEDACVFLQSLKPTGLTDLMRAVRTGIALLSGAPLSKSTIPSSSYSSTPQQEGFDTIALHNLRKDDSKLGISDSLFPEPLGHSMKDYIPYLFVITDGADPMERNVCRYLSMYCSDNMIQTPGTNIFRNSQFKGTPPVSPLGMPRMSALEPSSYEDRFKLKKALRIHTLGVGIHCNMFFLKILSLMGRGSVSHSLNPATLKNDIIKMIQHAEQPILTNLRLGFEPGEKAPVLQPVPKGKKKAKPLPHAPLPSVSPEKPLLTEIMPDYNLNTNGAVTDESKIMKREENGGIQNKKEIIRPSRIITTALHREEPCLNNYTPITPSSAKLASMFGVPITNGETTIEFFPSPISDLMGGEPLIITGKIEGKVPEVLYLVGLGANEKEIFYEIPIVKSKQIPLQRLCIQQQLEVLTAMSWLLNDDPELKQKAIELSCRYSVPCAYTSMVTVEEDMSSNHCERLFSPKQVVAATVGFLGVCNVVALSLWLIPSMFSELGIDALPRVDDLCSMFMGMFLCSHCCH